MCFVGDRCRGGACPALRGPFSHRSKRRGTDSLPSGSVSLSIRGSIRHHAQPCSSAVDDSFHAGGAKYAGGASPSLHNNKNNNSVDSITGTDIRHVMRVLKSQTSRLSGAAPLWQRSYYDHVVRHEAEYNEIAEYIGGNPARWCEDRFYTQ